jgi:hypothetical protein
MMNDAIKQHFGSYAGNTDESLAYLWKRLQKCESYLDCIPLLKEYKQVQQDNEKNFVNAFVKQADIVSKSVDTAKLLLDHGGADLRLIDLWKAKYEPDNASKIAADCMNEYSKKPQQIAFTIMADTGEPSISLGYNSNLTGIKTTYRLFDDDNDVYTVGWLHNLVSMDHNVLLAKAEHNENTHLIESSKARTQLIEAAYRFRMYEALPLPDWSEITGAAADSVTVETGSGDRVYYREIAYWMICEGWIVNGKNDALDKYDKSELGASRARTRGVQLLKHYKDLQNRMGFEDRRLLEFMKLQHFVLMNFELSANGRAKLLVEIQELESMQ